MRKLVFFVGPAGAGKTTLAKALIKQHPAAFLDMDTLLLPAAKKIMTLTHQDPSDRDSPVYKEYCRDLGYRITMDAALENLELGLDAYVIGPFTKETQDPDWLENELSKIGASIHDVDIKVISVFLHEEHLYQLRINDRNSAIDKWKLANWDSFSQSLIRREVKWQLPDYAIFYFDNSESLISANVLIERFVYN